MCHDLAHIDCIFAVENKKINIMKDYMKPYDCDLKYYEGCLATRDFWDDCGHEWTYKTLDEKLVILGGFVQRGGSLKRVIKRYAEDRSEIYRCRIHWVIFTYIWRMIMGDEPMSNFNPMSKRIKCLDNDELIKLLSEELKKCVKETCGTRYNRFGQHEIYNYWFVSNEYQYDDTALDKIERKHWRTNPDEPFSIYCNKAKRWERLSCLF